MIYRCFPRWMWVSVSPCWNQVYLFPSEYKCQFNLCFTSIVIKKDLNSSGLGSVLLCVAGHSEWDVGTTGSCLCALWSSILERGPFNHPSVIGCRCTPLFCPPQAGLCHPHPIRIAPVRVICDLHVVRPRVCCSSIWHTWKLSSMHFLLLNLEDWTLKCL